MNVVVGLLLIAAGQPLVHHATKVETTSWEPIAILAVTQIVEEAALSELTKPGCMRLHETSPAKLQEGEYTLLVQGRFIAEAEHFSAYLTFGPGKRDDLPSSYAFRTAPVGRIARAKMEQRIQQTVRSAARSLAEVVCPQLESVRLRVKPPLLEQPVVPVEWGEIDIPDVSKMARRKNKAIRDLLQVRNMDHVRTRALMALEKLAFDQKPPRDAILTCVLRDPDPKLRLLCVRALEPIARMHVPTQRRLLYAMRMEIDNDVLSELAKVSSSFVGLARAEMFATWLHLLASDGTPARAAKEIGGLLLREKVVPNLELTVARCLQLEALPKEKKAACSWQLRNIPKERRLPVAWRYLERETVYGWNKQQTFEYVLDSVLHEPGEERISDLLLGLAERKSTGRSRRHVIHQAGRYCKPTTEAVQRLMRVAYQVEVSGAAALAVAELARRDRALVGLAIDALERLQRETDWTSGPRRADPYGDLKRALKRLRPLRR